MPFLVFMYLYHSRKYYLIRCQAIKLQNQLTDVGDYIPFKFAMFSGLTTSCRPPSPAAGLTPLLIRGYISNFYKA